MGRNARDFDRVNAQGTATVVAAAQAERELGWKPLDIVDGLRATLAAHDLL